MSKSNTFENELLLHVFNNAALPLIGDAAGLLPAAAAGSLYVAFHTADPTETGVQTTSETAYTGYARVAVARTAGGWTVTGNSVSPTNNVDAGECTAAAGADLTYVSVGTAPSGAGKILYRALLSPAIPMAVGRIPRLKNTSTITEE